jgi:DNA polymerase-3 subunit gamma/tau
MADEHYLALYRKYRPMTFEDVRGRDAIVRTLRNQIMTGRISHSYLFCGTRGTGKTTIAKIFAKAVNCEDPQDGSPCGKCASCRAIERNAALNVTELDAASNNSVEDIRRIIDQVAYSPDQGKYRIYILDEAHMLSNAAANALLKTLEEPPSYAIFILATTEPNKLPVTILSRCQRFDFGRLPLVVIEGRLREVAEREGLQIEDRAYHYMAGAADGSMRDGLSLLDQCNAFNYGNALLTYERTLEILGAVDTVVFSDLFGCLHAGKVPGALKILDDVLLQGRELVQFITDFTWYLRNLMLLRADEQVGRSLDVSAENLKRMLRDEKSADMAEIMRYIRIFSALTGEIRFSSSRRILTEMALIRACRAAMDAGSSDKSGDSLEGLQARVQKLEQRLIENESFMADLVIKGGSVSGAAAPAGQMAEAPQPAAPQISPEKKAALKAATPEGIRKIVGKWDALVNDFPSDLDYMKRYIKGGCVHILPPVKEGEIRIAFDNSIAYGMCMSDSKKDDRERLADYFSQAAGEKMSVAFETLDKNQQNTENGIYLDDLFKDSVDWDGNIETEDF